MQLFAPPASHPAQRPPFKRPGITPSFKVGRWYLPLMATVAVGFGVANHYSSHRQRYHHQLEQDEERLRKNQEIMDAYGDKQNVQDIERALAVYEIQ